MLATQKRRQAPPKTPAAFDDWLRRLSPLPLPLYFLFTVLTAVNLILAIPEELRTYKLLHIAMRDSRVTEGIVYHSARGSIKNVFCVTGGPCWFFRSIDSSRKFLNQGLDIANTVSEGLHVRVTYSGWIILRLEVSG
jgi:hypothetical protein